MEAAVEGWYAIMSLPVDEGKRNSPCCARVSYLYGTVAAAALGRCLLDGVGSLCSTGGGILVNEDRSRLLGLSKRVPSFSPLSYRWLKTAGDEFGSFEEERWSGNWT